MTLDSVRSTTKRIREFSAVPFMLVAGISLLGVFYRPAPQAVTGGPINAGDTAWMLTATGLVLLMTPGLSFFYGGMVRAKNVVSTMLQSFVAMGVISLLWIVVGFSLAFGNSIHGLIGDPRTFFMFTRVGALTHPDLAPTIPLIVFALFQLKFAIITPALITGSFAERVRFSSYLLFMCLFSIFIYSPLAHWTWHPDGFLHKMGVLDFAGGTVVHMSAGFAALAGAMVLGRRGTHQAGEAHIPANIPFVILGTGLLWFGWFGFNAGSALSASGQAAMAFATTNTASASAALAWIFFDRMRGQKPSALGACVGAVVGLVAITPAAGYVSIGESIFIGTVRERHLEPDGALEERVRPRRHAGRLPVPRRRRHGRHADDRHLRQGRRPHVRPRGDVPACTAARWCSSPCSRSAARGSSTSSPTSSSRCASPRSRKRSASTSASTARSCRTPVPAPRCRSWPVRRKTRN